MKKTGLLISLLLILLLAGKSTAQNLVCNDLIYFSLDENCTHTILAEEVLEGALFNNCVVELDKTAPFGNGPWLAPILGPADVGNTYQVRVRHIPTGQLCWGNAKVEDKLPPVFECEGLSTISLNGGGPINVATNNLSLSAVDACSQATLEPAALQLDCADLGINTVQFTATDASGNSATCLHTILVANSDNCQNCVNECPESVAVSFDEGNLNLLPAFQTSNWSPFDAYGNALFDAATCSYVDSAYSVNYQVGTAGQSWFTRQWLWADAGGQIIPCEQVIVFPATHIVTIQGKVFIDSDDDCLPDAGEQGVDHYSLVVTILPSGLTQSFFPQPDGTYSVDVKLGVMDSGAEIHLALPANLNPVCATALSIPNSTNTPVYTFDMGIQSQGNCPVMQVNIGNLFLRRCATNSFNVSYCNMGLDTAYGAFITVHLDPEISLQFADWPYTTSTLDDLYTFQLGDVPPFFCGTIALQGMVSCSVANGQTLCNEVNIYPDVPCNGAWQGPEVAAAAYCSGDSVSLTLWNKGPQDMSLPLNYIVVEDFIMYKDGTFKLPSGDSVTIKVPANGSTWRIEADQAPGFPIAGLVAAAIEGCGGFNSPGMINVYGQSDQAMTNDQYCGVVVASCDPNDKTAVPLGYSDSHIIRANEAIEYKIRFQNTGTDTAFQVVVMDTLSPLLDVRSLELGASSHPYHLDVFPNGVLRFVFQPIALPDSNVNEPLSHGYLQFRIAQQPNLSNGLVIENQAAIYFDQNAPVFTNTSFHTIGYPFVPNIPLAYTTETRPPTCHGAADGWIFVAASGGIAPYTYLWADPNLQGDSLTGLAAGAYHLTIQDSHGGVLVETIVLTEPDPIVLNMTAGATLGNDNSGTASVFATGGTGVYTYQWSNGASTESLSGLSAGDYTVVVTDANHCTQSNSVTVAQTVLPLSYTAQTEAPKCHTGSDGSILVNATGGLMPYTFHWSDPSLMGNALNGLPAGIYQLTLTDNFGGEIVQSFELTAPDPINLLVDSTPAVGNDNNGNASVQVSGGTGAYTYLWSNGATTGSISGLPAGVYTVLVTDANACTKSGTAQVSQIILPLNFTAQITNPGCFEGSDGSIFVEVTGGLMPYTFQWSDPNLHGNALSGLSAGTYALTLSDSNGSEYVETYTLQDPFPIVIDVTSSPAIGNQSNGTASTLVFGGAGAYTYLWNNGETTANLTGLASGEYIVTVTDGNGCTQSVSVEVEQLVASKEPGIPAQIQVWPNPAHDRIVVNLEAVLPQLTRLDLLGSDGRLLRQIDSRELQAMMTLQLENGSAAGFVVLVLHSRDGRIFLEKVLIQ